MEETIILYPSPGIGHLVAMVELGKLILSHHPSFSIIILITNAPYNTGSTAPYISHVSATTPSITFHHLPTTTIPPNAPTRIENLAFELPRINNPNVRELLQSISARSKLKAFIIDFFCNAAFEVSSSLNIPTYYFFTSGASGLSIFLNLPTLHETMTTSIKDFSGTHLEFPGTPALSPLDMPEVLYDRHSTTYMNFLNTARDMAKASGILVNTFEHLEPRALQALSDGKCIPDRPTPPVYAIGPLIASSDKTGDAHENECIKWLNTQPSKSVVFLSFGSLGSFTAEQLKDMATGLENSGHRFLWVVRNPPNDKEIAEASQPQEPDLDALLPRGFLDRTKDRGLVVKSWAPQVAVLNHDAVGGFVTHCGWNSILEALCGGVPMLAWPLYAEQRLNRVFMVEEMKVALALTESDGGFVAADELEKKIKELMGLETGKRVREIVANMRNAAKVALAECGSSRIAITSLIET